jgi:hypothetical protein
MSPKPTSRLGWKNVTELSMFINILSFVLLDPATPSKNHFSMMKARLMLVRYQIAKFSADKKSLVFNEADELSADAVSPYDQNLEALIVSRACEVMLPPSLRLRVEPEAWQEFENFVQPFCDIPATHACDTLKTGLQLSVLRPLNRPSAIHHLTSVIDNAYCGDMTPKDIIHVFKLLQRASTWHSGQSVRL